jgi:hypothetical protein
MIPIYTDMGDVLDILRKTTIETLRDQIKDAKEAMKAIAEPYLKDISEETVKYTASALKGDPEAKQNLLHLQAQIEMLSALLRREESEEMAAKFEAVSLSIARIAIKLLFTL